MRVRIIRHLTGTVDGISLDQFEVGRVYDVGTSLCNYFMANRWAEPVPDEGPALVVPLDDVPPDTANDQPPRKRR